MSQNATIDSIFKSQLQQMEQPGADENWQRLEKELLAQQKKKRRGGAWLLGLLLLLGGSAALVWGLQGNQKQDGSTVGSTNQVKPAAGTATTHLPDANSGTPTGGSSNSSDAINTEPSSVTANTGNNHINSVCLTKKQSKKSK
jgi:hypothetical protein